MRSRSSARTARKPCRWVERSASVPVAAPWHPSRAQVCCTVVAWVMVAVGAGPHHSAAPSPRESQPMLERTPPQFRELQEITMQTDTRDILAHATRQAESYEDYFLVDIDAHVTETSFWPEILAIDRQRRDPPDGRGHRRPSGQRQRRAAQQPARHPLPARLRPHPAPAGAAGEGREEAASIISPSWRGAPWTRSASTIRSCSRRRC